MFLKFRSNNPNFSHLIGKNPDSPPKIISLRKGIAVGWYNDGYCVRFIEGDDEVSFPSRKDESFEYLSPTRYNSAMCVLNLLNEFMKLNSEYDWNVYPPWHSVEIVSLHIKDRTLKTIEHYFPVEISRLGYQNYVTLRVTDNRTFSDILDLVRSIVLFVFLDNEEIYVEDDFVKKYANCVRKAPFFVRYLFKVNLLRNKKRFEEIGPTITQDNETLVIGSLNENRVLFVKNNLPERAKVLDVGCGEFQYGSRFANKCEKYVGVDPDRDQRALAEKKIKNKKLDNAHVFSSLEEIQDWDSFYADTVLIIEVIEHMEWEKVAPFLISIRNQQPDAKFLITTPDVRFNVHYPVELRHEGHMFEASRNEMENLLTSIFDHVEYVPIGDVVSGISATQGYVCCDVTQGVPL